jgi:segregation and condensation protein A
MKKPLHFKFTEEHSGPLDLLLSLVDEQKLDISELSLSQVTEQFLNYLDQIEETKPEELADFLVIATRLLLLKSKKLLPQFSPEEDEGPSLADQLRLYKLFVEASHKLNKKWLSGLRGVFRIEPPHRPEGFVPPLNVSQDTLRLSIENLLKRLQPPKPLPKTFIDKAVSMKEKIDQIRQLLSRNKQVNFSQVLSDAENRTEVIVGFLALLELVKQKSVALNQSDNFGEINIFKVN